MHHSSSRKRNKFIYHQIHHHQVNETIIMHHHQVKETRIIIIIINWKKHHFIEPDPTTPTTNVLSQGSITLNRREHTWRSRRMLTINNMKLVGEGEEANNEIHRDKSMRVFSNVCLFCIVWQRCLLACLFCLFAIKTKYIIRRLQRWFTSQTSRAVRRRWGHRVDVERSQSLWQLRQRCGCCCAGNCRETIHKRGRTCWHRRLARSSRRARATTTWRWQRIASSACSATRRCW